MRVIYLSILLLLASCTSTVEELKLPINKERPTLTILVTDQSKSAAYIPVPMNELKQLFNDDAFHGGSQVVLLHITENSEKQSPWMSETVEASTKPISGNYYRQNRMSKENEQAIEVINKELSNMIDSIEAKLITERTLMYSDVNSALQLAAQMANSYAVKGYKIRVLIFSDLLQDTPKTSSLQPVIITESAEIILVGAHLKLDAATVFPKNTVEQVPVFKFN